MSIPAASFMRAMRTSTCAAASAGTTLVRDPPLTIPTLTVKPFFRSVKAGDFLDLTRQLKNRVHTLLEIEAGMRSLAGNFDEIFANSFARSFHGALASIGRFEHEHGRSFFCQRLGDRSR